MDQAAVPEPLGLEVFLYLVFALGPIVENRRRPFKESCKYTDII